MMKYSLCITTPEVKAEIPVALLAGTFDERLARAKALGYDGVELMTVSPGQLDIHGIKESLAALGLEVSAIATGAAAFSQGLTLLSADKKTALEARRRFSEIIKLAGSLGAPVVTVGSFRGRAASAGGLENARQQLTAILKEAAIEADAAGVKIALEPINRYETDFMRNSEEAFRFIESAGCANLGILLDTFHINIEEKNYTDCLLKAALRNILFHVHIGDSNRLPPGQGHIDFTEILKTLEKVNYRGYISAELLAGENPDASAQETIDSIKKFEQMALVKS